VFIAVFSAKGRSQYLQAPSLFGKCVFPLMSSKERKQCSLNFNHKEKAMNHLDYAESFPLNRYPAVLDNQRTAFAFFKNPRLIQKAD